MYTADDNLTLENIGGGAALEMFQNELVKVLENITDPNKREDTTREINLKFKFKPMKDHPDMFFVEIHPSSKLAGQNVFATSCVVGPGERGRIEARELLSGQRSLWEEEQDNVTKLRRE